MPLQEGLGEGLGAFELSRLLGRAEAGDAGGGQTVRDPGGQRHLGADHDQVGLHLTRKSSDGVGIVSLHLGLQLGVFGDAGIAGRADQARHLRRRRDLPRQGVFAPT
jgi:hypothetical protein